ncbi:TPA: hypothetical protein DEP58_04595 [Patescibacteria group bacterium]|nr:MAG: hypothetical protein UU98_C0018G0045 [Parcubacteria group bacterium GW2011_GWD2_42_14]HCC05545.1 hypothetical protein [Patescibacteria group bacterium]
MLVIKVWCLPRSTERKLRHVFESIIKAVEDVPELDLKGKDSMKVLFPLDIMEFGLGTETIIEGHLEKSDRTKKCRNHLAERLGVALKKHLPKANAECWVSPDDLSQRFWINLKSIESKTWDFDPQHDSFSYPGLR